MRKILKIIRFISNHPLTKDDTFAALLRFLKWQIIKSFYPYPFLYPFVDNSKLIVQKGMSAATGNIYVGLLEFDDMAFLLHLLRPGDLFGDIGANIGAYTILASGVAKANSFTVEPIPVTFKHLNNNIKINDLENVVTAFNNGVGATEGNLRFTKSYDTINHVVGEETISSNDTVQVPVITMDFLFSKKTPTLLKIDVEGFELNVLKGGENVLRNDDLKAIIIELNGSGGRYAIPDEEVHNYLLNFKFNPYSYNPFERDLKSLPTFVSHANTIYIKDENFVKERILTSRSYSLLGKHF